MPTAVKSANHEVISSPLDQRQYQLLHLPNGLPVTLVHDPKAQQSAAAMAINAGHFDDPQAVQGLAHFLEHMLFLGTQRYPEADAYQQFISQYGGHHNAWTGTEFTNFYFNIDSEQFAPALARFCEFFKQPLFSQQWIEKERQSVESEFRLKQQDELRRLYQVHKVTANPDHPFAKFSVGNLQTLQDTADKTLQQHLQDFFNEHYSANRMSLVLVGPQPLAQLVQLAQRYFADIANHGREKAPIEVPLYRPEQLASCIYMRPIKVARRLILTFPLPGIDDDYRHKTTSFLAHIIGYEGPGSLYSALRQRQWVTSLSAGGGISGSNFKDFNINLQLTEAGYEQIEAVTRWVLAYIRLIERQGLETWRYQERHNTVALRFRYQEPTRPLDLASQLAINRFHYSAEDIVYGDYRMDGLNLEQAQQTLALMQVKNLRMTVIGNDVPVDQVTPLYDAEYRMVALTKQQRFALQQAPEDFHAQLPAPNPYIPEDLQAQPLASKEGHTVNHPQALIRQCGLTIWHYQDPDFRVPKGHIYINFLAANVVKDARHFAIARLWCEMLMDALNEACYDAEVAGLHFNIYPQQTGISVHLTGLSAGLLTLLKQILVAFKHAVLDPSRWQSLKHNLMSNWRSAHTHKPVNQLFAELNHRLQPGYFPLLTLAEAIEDLDFAEFHQTAEQLLQQVEAVALCHGDWQADVATELQTLLAQHVHCNDTRDQLPHVQMLARGEQQDILSTQHNDSAIVLYNQGAKDDLHEQTGYMLLNHLLGPDIFTRLRTQQQLGYLVGSSYLPMRRHPGLLIYIQSPSHEPTQLREHISRCLQQLVAELAHLQASEWQDACASISAQINDSDPNLRVRSQRFWGAISLGDECFDRAQQIQQSLQRWDQTALLRFAQQRLLEQPANLWLMSDRGF